MKDYKENNVKMKIKMKKIVRKREEREIYKLVIKKKNKTKKKQTE